jgi:hypothetical protein
MISNPHKAIKIILIKFIFLLLANFSLASTSTTNDNSNCDINQLLKDMQGQTTAKNTINLIDYQKLKTTPDSALIKNHLPEFSIFLNEIENNKIMSIISKNYNP